jgi:hypothetical protein
MTAAQDAFERWAYGEGFAAGELDGRKRGFDEGYAAGFDAGARAGAARTLVAPEHAASGPADARTAFHGTMGGRR